MAIQHIDIRGFKSIHGVGVQLFPGLNMLIGPNGVGKSNFLSVFAMFNALTERRFQSWVAKSGGASAVMFGGGELRFMSVILRFQATAVAQLANELSFGATFFRRPQDRLTVNASGANDAIPASGMVELSQPEELELEWTGRAAPDEPKKAAIVTIKEALERTRAFHFHDTSENALVKASCDINDYRYLRRDASNLGAFLLMLKKAHPGHYAQIRSTIQLAFPLFDDFILESTPENDKRILMRWRERGSDRDFYAYQFSDGTLRFICLTTLLLQPFDVPQAPLTMTIDEPELGLHPAALVLLAGMLKEAAAKTQIIVATQSAALLSAVDEPEAVVVVERKQRETTMRRLTKEELEPWLEEYTLGDIWEKGVIGGRP
jgi:predicted ATPase